MSTTKSGLSDLAGRLKGFSETLFARVRIAADEPPRVLPVARRRRAQAAVPRGAWPETLSFAGRAFWTARNEPL